MTVVDNLMLGRAHGRLDRRGRRNQAVSTAYGLDVDPGRLVGAMSIGEKQRLEFVKCLLGGPRLLVLDGRPQCCPRRRSTLLLDICKRIAASGCSIILVTLRLPKSAWLQTARRCFAPAGPARHDARAEMDIDQLVRAMVGRSIDRLDERSAMMPSCS